MAKYRVAFFRQYPFASGQKIHIVDGRWRGDWEVVAAGEGTLRVRCPISGREFEWKSFYHLVEESDGVEWPAQDS